MLNFLKQKYRTLFFKTRQVLEALDTQDLSRFAEQDIILETGDDIKFQIRAWIDKRFMDAFIDYPIEILERGGVYLPNTIKIQFIKEEKQRPKVIVYETPSRRKSIKLLELRLIMVAEE